ncbi:16S rRNA (guanine(966)-N(2))-methyltransferase RsmD [Tessaracoccus terricola]
MSRIISGRARGKRLASPKGDATRPTTDRVKEALFSSLATWFGTVDADSSQQLEGVAVLDLYSGGGGLGLEAASRGAARVVCVDNRTGPLIRENAATAGLRVEVNSGSVDAALKSSPGRFDLVFIDPPYDVPTATVERILGSLVAGDALLPQALVVVERSKRSGDPSWPEPFGDVWERGYGETTLHFGALREEQE